MLAALAGFLVLCGLVLFTIGPGEEEAGGEGKKDVSVPERVLESFEAAQRAQRALESKNYGEAREHLAETQQALASALADLEGIPKED